MQDEYNRLTDEIDKARAAVREHLQTGIVVASHVGDLQMPQRVVDESWLADYKALRAIADAAEDRLVDFLRRRR